MSSRSEDFFIRDLFPISHHFFKFSNFLSINCRSRVIKASLFRRSRRITCHICCNSNIPRTMMLHSCSYDHVSSCSFSTVFMIQNSRRCPTSRDLIDRKRVLFHSYCSKRSNLFHSIEMETRFFFFRTMSHHTSLEMIDARMFLDRKTTSSLSPMEKFQCLSIYIVIALVVGKNIVGNDESLFHTQLSDSHESDLDKWQRTFLEKNDVYEGEVLPNFKKM